MSIDVMAVSTPHVESVSGKSASSGAAADGPGVAQGSAFSSQLKGAITDTNNNSSTTQNGGSAEKSGNDDSAGKDSSDSAVKNEDISSVVPQILTLMPGINGPRVIVLPTGQTSQGNGGAPAVGEIPGNPTGGGAANGIGDADKKEVTDNQGKMTLPKGLTVAARDKQAASFAEIKNNMTEALPDSALKDSVGTFSVQEQKTLKVQASAGQDKIMQALKADAANTEPMRVQVISLPGGKEQPQGITNAEAEAAAQKSDLKIAEAKNGRESQPGGDNGPMYSPAQGPQAEHLKAEVTVKEPLHVSRLEELGEAVTKALETGGKSLTVRLDPPDLGSIQIRLKIQGGVLTADVKVDSQSVKDMMNGAMPQIKTTLENSGIRAGNFQVDVREDGYSQGRKQQEQESGRQRNRRSKEPEEQFFNFFA